MPTPAARALAAACNKMATVEQIRNFCYNITAYHEKEGEEQFYDFTIKDKTGAEMQAHRFILACQSEYFAGLFRMNPTATEATFVDFSLDVIKTCIDGLYTHQVNVTGSNVQDVLTFANFINLSDVADVCVNFMISNMDESNYALVMELGNDQGLNQLVEASVLFISRNLRKISFNDFTQKMVIKVARWQMKRPTIMTREQWIVCQLKNIFLSVPKGELVVKARSSSIYANNATNWGPKLAVNGIISDSGILYYHSEEENYPWLEIKLPSPILISSLTIVNRRDDCWDRLRNLEIRAGMEPVPEGFTVRARGHQGNGRLKVNSPCGHFAGPAEKLEGPVITFYQPTLAQYLTLQILERGYLQINGLKINGGVLLSDCDLLVD